MNSVTHQLTDGVYNNFMPVVDDALSVVLDEELSTAPTLQLNTHTAHQTSTLANLF